MKIKRLVILLVFLLLLTSCIGSSEKSAVGIPGEVGETIIGLGGDTEEGSEEEVEEGAYQYLLQLGKLYTIDDMEITITHMESAAAIKFDLNGEEKALKDTKVREIYDGYSFMMVSYDFRGYNNNFVLMEIKPFELEENQHLIYKDEWQEIGNSEIKLEGSRSDGFIKITSCKQNVTNGCESFVTIGKGESEEVNEQMIKNIENFFKVKQYALIEVTNVSTE